MKNFISQTKVFIFNNWKLIVLITILIIAASLRLYRIREYMVFLGDEGRDMLVVKRMIVDHKLTLLGPITSVGSMYMGPIYYYFMVPFLWLWNLDPVGPSIMVALFAIATVALIYKTGEEYFHPVVGIFAALLYSTSPLTIFYGRSSWNPNIVPFFALLTMYSILKVVVKKQYNWLIIAGLSMGMLIQLHYVTLLMIPVIVCSLLLLRFKIPIKKVVFAIAGFILTYSPFLLFEIRHGFVNFQGVIRFLSEEKTSERLTFKAYFDTVYDVFVRLFWRLIVIENAEWTKVFIVILAITFIVAYFYKKSAIIFSKSAQVIGIWFLIGICAYGFYRGPIYDYYFGALYPVVFLWTGIMLYLLYQLKIYYKLAGLAIFILLIFFHVKNSPLQYEPNNLLKNTEEISRFVYDKIQDEPYNFALIAGKNSDHAYRYFLERWDKPPVVIENPVIDPARKTVTNRLLIVCEDKECSPLGHPLWEIAGFGSAEIIDEWKVSTARVFLLVPYNKDK